MTIEQKREKNRLKNKLWREKNREKCCKSTAQWRIKNPEYEGNHKLKIRYGITTEKYTELLAIQEHRCAICGNEEIAVHNKTKKIQKLAVDHCHKTGKVRGLLCQDCNRGIGLFHEDISRLRKAIDYLVKCNN
jgi:hypothetical protein